MEALTIRIYAAAEGGYMYDIYDTDVADNIEPELESVDGGLCTTTMLNALGMAAQQAEELIERAKGEECPGCGADMGGDHQPPQAISRYQHGRLCSPCGTQEAIEGDFIGER